LGVQHRDWQRCEEHVQEDDLLRSFHWSPSTLLHSINQIPSSLIVSGTITGIIQSMNTPLLLRRLPTIHMPASRSRITVDTAWAIALPPSVLFRGGG
jgi:hypothetical protein